MSDLGAYLAAARSKPWKWGAHDCTAFPALWAGFFDALPAYESEAEADALLREPGGLASLWERAVAAFPGKVERVEPGCLAPGDVAVIDLPVIREVEETDEQGKRAVVEPVEIGAIWTGKRWAFVPLAGGIACIADARCIRAWRPQCPR